MNAQEAKRRRTMSAQQTKEVSTEEPIDINFRMLSGKDIGTISIAPTASGRDLMERARALLGYPRGIVTLAAGDIPVTDESSIGSLRGATVQCIIVQITDKQEKAALSAGLAGRRSRQNWQVWDGIRHVHLTRLTPSNVSMPNGLQSITFGDRFNQSLETVTLPGGLQTITFGYRFNQSLEKVALPGGLQAITFGYHFNQSLEKVALPSGLQAITFGDDFNQSLENVVLPRGLHTITFGRGFNQRLDTVFLPSDVRVITSLP